MSWTPAEPPSIRHRTPFSPSRSRRMHGTSHRFAFGLERSPRLQRDQKSSSFHFFSAFSNGFQWFPMVSSLCLCYLSSLSYLLTYLLLMLPFKDMSGAPQWIPARSDGCSFLSEISGIPWMGPKTLESPMQLEPKSQRREEKRREVYYVFGLNYLTSIHKQFTLFSHGVTLLALG